MDDERVGLVRKFFSDKKVLRYYKNLGLREEEMNVFREFLNKKGNVLDLMCGAGRATAWLSKHGFRVYCVDNNAKMLNVVKTRFKKLKNIRIINNDASTFVKYEFFDYIIVLENSIEHITTNNRLKSMKNIHASLKDGGVFITSFHSIFNPSMLPMLLFNNFKGVLCGSFKFNDCVLNLPDFGNLKVFHHVYSYWFIKRFLKKIGYKHVYVFSVNELNTAYNRIFKNVNVYKHLRPFLYCYWVCIK